MRQIERIREKENREEQKKALDEYKKKAKEEAERQKAEMQEPVNLTKSARSLTLTSLRNLSCWLVRDASNEALMFWIKVLLFRRPELKLSWYKLMKMILIKFFSVESLLSVIWLVCYWLVSQTFVFYYHSSYLLLQWKIQITYIYQTFFPHNELNTN